MPTDNPPIDWTADYDIFDPDFVRDPYPTMHEIRESGCPIAHTIDGAGRGCRPGTTTSSRSPKSTTCSRLANIIVVPPPTGQLEGPYSGVAAPPITSDPPEHHWHRRTILPTFAPQAVAKYEDGTRALCHQLIDGFIDSGQADAAADYAQQIPVRVIATMLGVPLDMADEFTSWVRGVLEIGLIDPKVRVENRMKILGYLPRPTRRSQGQPPRQRLDHRPAEHPCRRRARLRGLRDGRLQSDARCRHRHDVVGDRVVLVAPCAASRTSSTTARTTRHLAAAIEELLRAYSPVTMARIVDHDTEFQGCPMHAGDRVLMSFPAANRDPRQFDNPDEVILDREHNRHVAFGSGIHRCAGSNLARLELRVALQTWMERIPDFELVDPRP